MQNKPQATTHWGRFALALSLLGAATFYLWQPISDYFLTGSFEPNLSIHVETEAFSIDSKDSLLVIHVKTTNRGNVPVELLGNEGKGEINLEVRKLDSLPAGAWIDPEKHTLVAKENVLAKHNGSYVVEPNGIFDDVESIALPNGLYWIKATLVYPDGDYIDHIAVVKLEK